MAKTHKGNTARRAGGHTLPAMSKGCQLIRRGPPWRLPGGSVLCLSLGMPVHSHKKVISAKEGGKKKNEPSDNAKGKMGENSFVNLPSLLPPFRRWFGGLKASLRETAASQRVSNCSAQTVPHQLYSAAPHGATQLCTTRIDTSGVPPRCQATMFILRYSSPCEAAGSRRSQIQSCRPPVITVIYHSH